MKGAAVRWLSCETGTVHAFNETTGAVRKALCGRWALVAKTDEGGLRCRYCKRALSAVAGQEPNGD